MRVNSGQESDADVTLRLHVPVLFTEILCSALAPPQTSPNVVEPVTRISPGGTLPDTLTSLIGESGSLLLTVRIAVFGPRLVG